MRLPWWKRFLLGRFSSALLEDFAAWHAQQKLDRFQAKQRELAAADACCGHLICSCDTKECANGNTSPA